EGDIIAINIPAGTIDLVVSPDEIERRKKNWRVPDHTALVKGSLLERYRRMVGSAIRGATFE
ncbi:MAG: dihydroxy-acid dehydratase, partial [Desulfatirhabdiaceae bacterium]|nr:dihydroxy-acid dehydratase [Desulfatirhabdiaceae bacterium]